MDFICVCFAFFGGWRGNELDTKREEHLIEASADDKRCPELYLIFVIHECVVEICFSQNYNAFARMTDFCETRVPSEVTEALQPICDDDEAVKNYGVDLGIAMCKMLMDGGAPGKLAKRVSRWMGGVSIVSSRFVRDQVLVMWEKKSRELSPVMLIVGLRWKIAKFPPSPHIGSLPCSTKRWVAREIEEFEMDAILAEREACSTIESTVSSVHGMPSCQGS